MHPPIRRVVSAALLIGALITPTTSAFAAGASQAVFVQTDDVSGNRVLAYRRGTDGPLTFSAAYRTGACAAHSKALYPIHSRPRARLCTTPRYSSA
jgi:hypothetical protein